MNAKYRFSLQFDSACGCWVARLKWKSLELDHGIEYACSEFPTDFGKSVFEFLVSVAEKDEKTA